MRCTAVETLNIGCVNDPLDRVELDDIGDNRLFITTGNDDDGVPVMLSIETAQQLAEALINWVNEVQTK